MTTLEVLRQAREIIARPENWTQGVGARTRTGRPTGVHSGDAYAYCATGAINRAIWDDPTGLRYNRAVARLGRIVQPDSPYRASGSEIAEWNDESSHSEILAAFDAAIAAK